MRGRPSPGARSGGGEHGGDGHWTAKGWRPAGVACAVKLDAPSPSTELLKALPHSLLLADRRASMKLGAGKAVESGGDGGGE